VWVSAAPADNTQSGPIVFRAAIYHAIDGDILNVITSWLLPDFSPTWALK
jgi:hypothetical protein